MASPPPTPTPSPSPSHESHRPTGYYYFVTAVIVVAFLLVASNVHVIGCCSPHRIMQAISRCFRSPQTLSPEQESSRRNQQIPARKYRKGDEDQDRQSDQECSVCLSAFVDGEDVRQLPQCRHSFHAPCIDMWLYSHADCPLCRTNISRPSPAPRRSMEVEDGPGPSRRPMESSV